MDLRGVLTSAAGKVAGVGAAVGKGAWHGGEVAVRGVAAAARKAAPEVRTRGKQAAKATGRLALLAGKEAVRLAKTPEVKKLAVVAVAAGIDILVPSASRAGSLLRAVAALVGKGAAGDTPV